MSHKLHWKLHIRVLLACKRLDKGWVNAPQPTGSHCVTPGENQAALASLPNSASPRRRRILTSWPPHGPHCWELKVQSPPLSIEHYLSPPLILVIDTAFQEKNNTEGGFEEHHLKRQ